MKTVTIELVLEDTLAQELEEFRDQEPDELYRIIELALTRRHIRRQREANEALEDVELTPLHTQLRRTRPN